MLAQIQITNIRREVRSKILSLIAIYFHIAISHISINENGPVHSDRDDRPSPPREPGKADPGQDRADAANPAALARNVKALVGSEQKRLRVQDFRILFTETADTITIHDIGPRGGIYD